MLLSSISQNIVDITYRDGIVSKINQEYLYTESNEWVELKGNIARVGIDDYSQNEFGEIVYVDLPSVGQEYSKDDEVCVIESVKTASDLYSPLSGKVIKVNRDLIDNPKLINQSCYNEGWLYEIEISSSKELEALLSSETYKKHVE